MLESIKSIMGLFGNKSGRLHLKMFFIRNLPGVSGVLIRSRLLRKHFASAGDNLRIHEGFRFRNIHKSQLGKNVTIGVDCYIQAGGDIEIGDNSILSPGVKIWTLDHSCDDTSQIIRDQSSQYRNVKIGNDVWIGTGAIVMPGAILRDGTVVKPGTVVEGKQYESYSILQGNPARVIGRREAVKNRLTEKFREDGLGTYKESPEMEFTNCPS